MNKLEGSKRLKKIADYVKGTGPILDIGSDHAYLPIYLIKEKEIKSAIAGEVVKGPFEKAKNEVENEKLSNQISVRLGNGFEVLKEEDKIDSIFICGMGGILISEIIKNGKEEDKIPEHSRLILQANNKEKDLRKCLEELNYAIIEEDIVKEKEKFYEIIVAEKSQSVPDYTNLEFSYGPILLKNKSKIFKEKWQKILNKNKNILKQLDKDKHQEEIEKLKEKNKEIEKVIA